MVVCSRYWPLRRFVCVVPRHRAASLTRWSKNVVSGWGHQAYGNLGLGTRAGDFVFVAGMRGIDPKTNALVPGEEAR